MLIHDTLYYSYQRPSWNENLLPSSFCCCCCCFYLSSSLSDRGFRNPRQSLQQNMGLYGLHIFHYKHCLPDLQVKFDHTKICRNITKGNLHLSTSTALLNYTQISNMPMCDKHTEVGFQKAVIQIRELKTNLKHRHASAHSRMSQKMLNWWILHIQHRMVSSLKWLTQRQTLRWQFRKVFN